MIIRKKDEWSDLPRDFVKIVADIERKILAVGCELHIDCADELLTDGSEGKNLWGANVFLDERRIDFVSFINIRPADGNRAMEIKLPDVKEKVDAIIKNLLF